MSEIRNGDVVYYKNNGRGHKFEGNLYVLSTRGNSCVGKDEAGKTHIFSTTNLLTTAIPTGLHFADEDEFFEHFQNKGDNQDEDEDITLDDLLVDDDDGYTCNITDGDVRLTIIDNANERRRGQIALTILNPFPEFDKDVRYQIKYKEKNKRIYVFKAIKRGAGYKVQTISSHPRLTKTDRKLWEKLKAEGHKVLCLNWKLDSKCHAYYISLKEELS